MVCSGAYKNLNIWDNKLYFTDAQGTSIYTVENAHEAQDETQRKYADAPAGTHIESMVLAKYSKACVIYLLVRTQTGYQIQSLAIDAHDPQYFRGAEFKGDKAWLCAKSDSLSVVVSATSAWHEYVINTPNLDSSEERSGTTSLQSALYAGDALVLQSSTSGYLQVNNGTNGQSDIGDIVDSIAHITASGQAVLVVTSTNKVYWFNANGGTFVNDVTDKFDVQNKQIKSVGSVGDTFVCVTNDGSLMSYNPSKGQLEDIAASK